jgi:hypothetical protein
MSESIITSNTVENHLPLEKRVERQATEIAALLLRAPGQQCRPEGAWNEGDDFIQGFTDIWGDQTK